jgi:hypothetical protein
MAFGRTTKRYAASNAEWGMYARCPKCGMQIDGMIQTMSCKCKRGDKK